MSKKHDIIIAALEEFSENSYDAASVNRIIKKSGTSKGTFYHYFKDKKALYVKLIEESVRIKQMYFSRTADKMRKGKKDFYSILKMQAKAGAEFMRDNPALSQFGSRFAVEQSPVKAEICKEIMPEIGVTFSGLIKVGVAAGSFSERYPEEFVERLVDYIMNNYYDILFDKNESPDTEIIEERLDMLFEFLKRGLG